MPAFEGCIRHALIDGDDPLTISGRNSLALDEHSHPSKWLEDEVRLVDCQTAKWQRLAHSAVRKIKDLRTQTISNPFVEIHTLDAAIKKELRQHRPPRWIGMHLSHWRALAQQMSGRWPGS